jgi:putative Holliday junction resolvase
VRYLAIDYGEKRIGLAGSDTGIVITPLEILSINSESVLDELTRAIQKYQPEEIIFGLPLRDDGQPTDLSSKVSEFADQLKPLIPEIKIHFVNEFMTSIEAQARTNKKRGEFIDDESAAIILEQFFNEKTD